MPHEYLSEAQNARFPDSCRYPTHVPELEPLGHVAKCYLGYMAGRDKKASRKQVNVAERRRRLLAASLRVRKREGITAATTHAICAEAAMPHRAFHYCFHSTTDLYATLLAGDIESDLATVRPKISSDASAQENIPKLLFAYWSQVETDPGAQLVLFDLESFVLRDPELQELPKWEHEVSARASLTQFAELVAGLTRKRTGFPV